jgi:hypothetical protein
MVRPCVARGFVDLVFGLASMYPASDWSGSLLRATMDISARSISLADRPRQAKGVTSVRSRREDRSPSRRYLSQTSAGKGLSASLLRHRRLLISLVPWFVLMAVRSSRPYPRHATRAGTVKAGPPGPLAELGLDRAEHGAMIMQVWSNHRVSSSLRSLVP